MSQHNLQKLLSTGALLTPVLLTTLAAAQSAPVAAPRPDGQAQPAPEQWTASPAPAPAPPPAGAAGPPPAPPSAAVPADTAPHPKIQIAEQAPPPAPVVVRTDKTHDGFYTRFALGFASQSTSLDDGSPAPNYEATSGALVFNALIGGAPAPGLIIGGALALDSLPSTTFKADDGYEAKTSVNLLSIGPFIDGYPNPRGGFHLGGTVGPAFARLNNNTGFAGSKATGVGLAAWLGYDWWVADQWSVGAMLRFSGANAWSSKNSQDLEVDVRSLALLFTAVYQ